MGRSIGFNYRQTKFLYIQNYKCRYAFWSKFLNQPGIKWTKRTTGLIQRILVLPFGSSEAERGFSIMNIKTSRRSALSRFHLEGLMRIRINTVNEIEKFAAKKYARGFVKEGHSRSDDSRCSTNRTMSLLEDENKNKKYLPKLSFL